MAARERMHHDSLLEFSQEDRVLNATRLVILGVLAWSGCGGPQSAPSTNTGGTVSGTSHSVATITPATGSTGGGTAATLTGTGFQSGATVAFDGVTATVSIVNTTTIQLTTPAHAAGPVAVWS